MRQAAALFALLVLAFAPCARAEVVSGLYEAAVPVESQDAEARDAAIRAGFEAVLVKLTGSLRVLENPDIADAVADAARHVVQFYFRRADPEPESDAPPPMLLHASFRPASVDALLRRAGEAVLPATRPGVLLWIVADDGTGRGLVNRDTAAETVRALNAGAAVRAIPLLFPLLDLEDEFAIGPEQVWGFDDTAVEAASKRYGAESVVAARFVAISTGEWLGEWRFLQGEQPAYGQGRAATREGLEEELIAFLAEEVASRFAIRADLENAERLRIRVDGVESFADYRKLATLLRRLGSVREAHISLLERGAVWFDLTTDSGSDSVTRELGLLPQLRANGAPDENRYRWVGG